METTQVGVFCLCLLLGSASGQNTTLIYGNSQYLADRNLFQGNFISAIAYCARMDMKLVSLESEAELEAVHDWVRILTGNTVVGWWTSGTRAGNDKDYIWLSTGQLVNVFEKWGEGEPSNGNQACLLFLMNVYRKGYYDDEGCHVREYAICEKTIDTPSNSN